MKILKIAHIKGNKIVLYKDVNEYSIELNGIIIHNHIYIDDIAKQLFNEEVNKINRIGK